MNSHSFGHKPSPTVGLPSSSPRKPLPAYTSSEIGMLRAGRRRRAAPTIVILSAACRVHALTPVSRRAKDPCCPCRKIRLSATTRVCRQPEGRGDASGILREPRNARVCGDPVGLAQDDKRGRCAQAGRDVYTDQRESGDPVQEPMQSRSGGTHRLVSWIPAFTGMTGRKPESIWVKLWVSTPNTD